MELSNSAVVSGGEWIRVSPEASYVAWGHREASNGLRFGIPYCMFQGSFRIVLVETWLQREIHRCQHLIGI